MKTPKGQIERAGKVHFHDASLAVWEEGISEARARGGWDAANAWERQFKRDVFARIVQTLHRLGWATQVGTHIFTGNNARYCTKGALQADLKISGRHIELDFFQNVNAPERPDHGGRYQRDQEKHMPYLLRIEMERTRRRIRDYLCNVFTGYTFEPPKANIGISGITAIEAAARDRCESCHYIAELDHASINTYGNRSRDGVDLTHEHHGGRAFAIDRRTRRVVTGQIFYSLNSQWQLVTGRYDLTYVSAGDIWINNPGGLRVKRNEDQRRKRLEGELQKAIAAMEFERAAELRDILFPNHPQLFVVWHTEHKLYHRSGFSGYSSDMSKAGKFTADEVRGWDRAPNRVIPVASMKAAA